jgi:hypothetical protein
LNDDHVVVLGAEFEAWLYFGAGYTLAGSFSGDSCSRCDSNICFANDAFTYLMPSNYWSSRQHLFF